MNSVFCSIISFSHLPFAKALAKSLAASGFKGSLHLLIIDATEDGSESNLQYYNLSQIGESARQLAEIYSPDSDEFRWALKPVWISHLLMLFEKVIYVDADICFFAPPEFLFDLLDSSSVILSPHRASFHPFKNPQKFSMHFTEGLYNAGFIGASRAGKEALAWWAEVCRYKISKDPCNGFMDDQRYLDLLPVIGPQVKILRHQGCNLGSWNIETCKRSLSSDRRVLINNSDEVVFIHFNHETIRQITKGNDALLQPYLNQYALWLGDSSFNTSKFENVPSMKTTTSGIKLMKQRLRLKTRLKRWLYKLSQRL